jgi:hypothetical protein
MLQVDNILKTNVLLPKEAHKVLSNPDPESQYIADPAPHEDAKQPATSSPGWDSVI